VIVYGALMGALLTDTFLGARKVRPRDGQRRETPPDTR
jgi:hypothetical protein